MPRTPDDARRLRLLAAVLLSELLIGGAAAIGARLAEPAGGRADAGDVARALELSGLAFGSGASYTRHPAQADALAPWSDFPGALERLPSGSLIPPCERPRDGEGGREDGAAEGAP